MRQPVHHVDRFFLLFDDPPPVACAWSFTVEGGPVDGLRLRDAVCKALVRRPKAAARLRREGRRLFWETAEAAAERAFVAEPPLDGASEPEADARRLARIMSAPLPPEEGPLLRVHWTPPGAFRGRLTFRFHHALSDGAGSLAFVREVLDAYNGVAPPGPPVAEDTSPLVSGPWRRKLGLLARLVSLHTRRSAAQSFALPHKLYDRARRPDGGLAHAWRHVPPARLERLRAASRETGAGLTEMLLAALALAAERDAQARGRRCGMLRISVTQNLRPRRADVLRLENRSSAFPVWVGPRDRASAGRLVASLRRQVRECLRLRAADATALFAAALRLPAPLARALLLPAATSSRIADSCAFANLGTVPDASDGEWFHLGPARLVGVHPVVRPAEGLGAIASAVIVDGTMELGLSHLTGLFADGEAERYLELADAALDELAALAPAVPASA